MRRLLDQINRELTNPLFETNAELKIRAQAYKGEIAHQCDLWAARQAWEQVLDLAKEIGNKEWEGRALGELGVLAYVTDGDSTRATLLVGKALFKVAETRDSWGGATYLTHSANSLSLIGRHEVALKFSEKAMTAANRSKFSISSCRLHWESPNAAGNGQRRASAGAGG